MNDWVPQVGMQVVRKNNPNIKGIVTNVKKHNDVSAAFEGPKSYVIGVAGLPKWFWMKERPMGSYSQYWMPLSVINIDSKEYNKLYE